MEERDTRKALAWIVKLLNDNQIPYQISGGCAAKIYGSPRQLDDIDIDIPRSYFEHILPEVKKRVVKLFEDVKKELVHDGVFDENEEIKLDDKSVAYVVGELEQYSLLKTDKDVVGDAFEVFAESKLVGEKGEFFTPREIVKTAVKIIDPQPQQSIIDPACGSGGFLIYSLEHIWNVMDNSKKYKGVRDLGILKREIAENYFFGIDKEIDLVKIAKAYMAIIGDGRGGIVQQNTLHTAEDYDGRATQSSRVVNIIEPKKTYHSQGGVFSFVYRIIIRF